MTLGAGQISTANLPWNGRGVTRAKSRFQTGYIRRLTIKCQALQRKKSKKYAALDKQHSDADKRQRGRRREQDNKAQHRPRLKIVASECFGLSRVRCAGWNGMDLLVQAQERV